MVNGGQITNVRCTNAGSVRLPSFNGAIHILVFRFWEPSLPLFVVLPFLRFGFVSDFEFRRPSRGRG